MLVPTRMTRWFDGKPHNGFQQSSFTHGWLLRQFDEFSQIQKWRVSVFTGSAMTSTQGVNSLLRREGKTVREHPETCWVRFFRSKVGLHCRNFGDELGCFYIYNSNKQPTSSTSIVYTCMQNSILFFFNYSPNSVATLWGSYGNRKAPGVNRWCALTGPVFLATLSVKSSLRDRESAFRLRETGPRRGPWWRCVLACAPCRFSEIGKLNVQNVRVLRGVQNHRKGCSKLEVVTILFFRGRCSISCSWSLSCRPRNARFVELSSNLDRLCWHHFAWQIQDFVCLGFIFSWHAQYLCHKTSKNRISYWEADVKVRSELWFFESRCGAVPISCLQVQLSRDSVRVRSLWL